MLNYGYSVILSAVNREVALNGYLTQLGLKHSNEFNHFNLSCDLMEPFRIEVDKYVYFHQKEELTKEHKYDLAAILGKSVRAFNMEMSLNQAIKIFVKSVTDVMNSGNISGLKSYEF